MGNRNMAVKHAKAATQRAEYAVQAGFREVSAPEKIGRVICGKLVTLPDDMADAIAAWHAAKAEEAAKVAATHELRLATREALGKRVRFAWSH